MLVCVFMCVSGHVGLQTNYICAVIVDWSSEHKAGNTVIEFLHQPLQSCKLCSFLSCVNSLQISLGWGGVVKDLEMYTVSHWPTCKGIFSWENTAHLERMTVPPFLIMCLTDYKNLLKDITYQPMSIKWILMDLHADHWSEPEARGKELQSLSLCRCCASKPTVDLWWPIPTRVYEGEYQSLKNVSTHC